MDWLIAPANVFSLSSILGHLFVCQGIGGRLTCMFV